MSDSDKLDRTRVDQLGLTDSINDDDKFIVSQRVEDDEDGNEQNATNIANFSTVCGHVAESDPVVNKMLEIHYQVPHDDFTGSVKPGFGIDMRGDGTLDNGLYMNQNLVFCGDDLSAGWLYNEKTHTYYKPNNLDLPMGMSYLRTSVHDGIEPSRTVATQVLDDQTYLGADFDHDTWVNKSAKLGKYLGESESGGLGFPNDKSYTDSNNAYAPFPEPIVEHVIEWTNIGLAVNQWYTTGFSGKNPFETIILCRVAARASISTLDPERRSLTITFKTREKNNQITSGSDFYYFKATLGPNDTEATLMSDTGEKLGRIIVRDYDNAIWSENFDKIHHKSTGMIKNNNQGNDRLLAWQIGLKRAGASGPPGGSTASSEDTFVDITKFLNGTLVVVGIKVEYGEQSTGFDKTYLHDFSSKDMVINQATDLAIYNTLVRETEKSMDRMDYLETTGKFPDIIFQKNRPASLVGSNFLDSEGHNALQRSDSNENMRINLNRTDIQGQEPLWYNVASYLNYIDTPELTPPTLFSDSYGEVYEATTSISSEYQPPADPGVNLNEDSIFDDTNNVNYPVRGRSVYHDEQIQENLKIANQAFSGNITVNAENFELKDRLVKCSTGDWRVVETGRESFWFPSDDDPDRRERVKSISYLITCNPNNLPVFSKVKDMLTLKPAGNLNLGGVRIGANSGLTVDPSGSLAFNAGSGLSIDPSTGEVSVTGGSGGAIIDDTTTTTDKVWSSSKVNTELGTKQDTLTAGTGIDITNNVISATGGGDAELEKTASGAVVSITDGADDLPVVDLTAQIVAVQSGSGDPSPSNVRPISGFTGVNVTRAGKNLFGFTANDFISAPTYGMSSYVVLKVPYGTYSISTNAPTGYIWAGTNLSSDYVRVYEGNPKTVITDTIYFGVLTTGINLSLSYNTMINQGAVLPYEPYNGTTYSVTWQTDAGTVYGGSIDLTTGVLTVTWLGVNLGQLEWTYSSVKKVFMTNSPISNIRIPPSTSVKPTWCKCEIYKIEASTDVYNSSETYDLSIAILNNGSLVVSDQSYNDATQFKTAMSGKIFASEVVTPQTYQLTPTEVKTLLGVNNIFADTGDVSVDYRTKTASDIIDLVETEVGVDDLANVDISTPTDGQVLKYNGTSGKWENGTGGGGGASDLADLGDVTITSPTNGQFLSYNSSSQKWRNVNAPEKYVTYNKMAYGNSVTISDAVVGRNAIELSMDFMATQESIPTSQPSSILPVQELRALLTWDSPETAQTLIAQFSNQYYGGYYDFVSGILKVTKDAMNITTCTMHNTYTSFFAKALTDTRFYSDPSKYHLCDEYILVDGTDMTISLLQNRCIMVWYGEWNGTTRWWIVWRDDSYTTNSAMTTHLSQVGGINLVGDLVTPVITSEGSQNIPLKTAGLTITSVSGYGNGSIIRLAYESSNSTTIIDYVQASTGLAELNDTQIASPTTGQVMIYNSTAGKWQNAEVPKPWTDVTGTLASGNTTLTLNNAAILTTSTIQVFTDVDGTKKPSIVVQTGSVTLTFDEAPQAALGVKVRVS